MDLFLGPKAKQEKAYFLSYGPDSMWREHSICHRRDTLANISYWQEMLVFSETTANSFRALQLYLNISI